MKSDLYRLKQGLESVGSLTGIKFAYAVAKNLRLVTDEVAVLDELHAPSEAFSKYEEARIALAEQHSEKDENGKPRILGSNGVSAYAIADRAAFDAELKEIRANHEEAIKARDDQLRSHNEFLKEPADLDLHLIGLDVVPEAITAGQMAAIFEIVREEQ